MKLSQFKRLAVGDIVTLANPLRAYDGANVIPAGSVGRIGAVNVPSVRRKGVRFHCVDFVPAVQLLDEYGIPQRGYETKRVSALPSDLI